MRYIHGAHWIYTIQPQALQSLQILQLQTALANRSKALNENFLSQPPVALIDSTESVILDDKNQVTMLNSIFEHRPIYDSNDTIPIRVRGTNKM